MLLELAKQDPCTQELSPHVRKPVVGDKSTVSAAKTHRMPSSAPTSERFRERGLANVPTHTTTRQSAVCACVRLYYKPAITSRLRQERARTRLCLQHSTAGRARRASPLSLVLCVCKESQCRAPSSLTQLTEVKPRSPRTTVSRGFGVCTDRGFAWCSDATTVPGPLRNMVSAHWHCRMRFSFRTSAILRVVLSFPGSGAQGQWW